MNTNKHLTVPIRKMSEVAADTLNWFDERGNLVIGSRSNPEHLAEWEKQWQRFRVEENKK